MCCLTKRAERAFPNVNSCLAAAVGLEKDGGLPNVPKLAFGWIVGDSAMLPPGVSNSSQAKMALFKPF